MRILLVGGTGFIGPEIVRRLAAGKHSVTVFHQRLSAPGSGCGGGRIAEAAALAVENDRRQAAFIT